MASKIINSCWEDHSRWMEGDSVLSSPTSAQTEQLVLFILCWSGFIMFHNIPKAVSPPTESSMTSHCPTEKWWVVVLFVCF